MKRITWHTYSINEMLLVTQEWSAFLPLTKFNSLRRFASKTKNMHIAFSIISLTYLFINWLTLGLARVNNRSQQIYCPSSPLPLLSTFLLPPQNTQTFPIHITYYHPIQLLRTQNTCVLTVPIAWMGPAYLVNTCCLHSLHNIPFINLLTSAPAISARKFAS